MNWSPQQVKALDDVGTWLRTGKKQVYRLMGYAGTGKTTLAKYLAEEATGTVQFCAYTGKAANVLREKGCYGATTIHQLIYLPGDKSRKKLNELRQELIDMRDEGGSDSEVAPLIQDIANEEKRLERPSFSLNLDSEIRNASLIVVDECSMVDERVGRDLLSFDVPVLVLGDKAQLPPVRGGGFFTAPKPDTLLTEIHRQARDNPIIRMATEIRETGRLKDMIYGDSRVVKGKPDPEIVLHADQVLCGKNSTRASVNRRCRHLLGFKTQLPSEGDRIVCLRNDHEMGLQNGTLWRVLNCHSFEGMDQISLEIKNETTSHLHVSAHPHYFQNREDELAFYMKKEAQEFDYGYGLTTHKAQGSQWPDVFVFDESYVFRGNAKNWLYTAITRASERVTVCRP